MTAKIYDEEDAIKFNFVSAISMVGASKWFRLFARLDIIPRKLISPYKLLSLVDFAVRVVSMASLSEIVSIHTSSLITEHPAYFPPDYA